MTWNHRVMKTLVGPDREESWGIHEVYYDDAGALTMYTDEPVDVSAESLAALSETLDRMRAAMDKPVLTAADFPAGAPEGAARG